MSVEILNLGRKLRAANYAAFVAAAPRLHVDAPKRVATAIVYRWIDAGYSTAVLIDGLPVPQGSHAGDWTREGQFWRCSCGARGYDAPASCYGLQPFDMVEAAVRRGVPFGLRDGLPTAGVEVDTSGIRERLARIEVAMMARKARTA